MNILLDTLMEMLENHQKLCQRALTENEFRSICSHLRANKKISSELIKELEKEGLIETERIRYSGKKITIKHNHQPQVPGV
jgi:DNA-binding MarR family transcriptional regulator